MSDPHTEEGTILGTVSYMSPEQAQGKPVDARSDIFNFGAVLYEMVTGTRAFRGDSSMSTLGAIIHKDPAPLGAEVPHDLERLITRCLRKDPERRFQHVDDVKIALEELKEESDSGTLAGVPGAGREARRAVPLRLIAALAVLLLAAAALWWRDRAPQTSGGSPEASIAVMPFLNQSPDPDSEYFSDGITDELISALSRVEGLKVIARSSVFRFKGEDYDIQDIGEQLGVGTVLEGTVRKAGNRLRITAQLTDVADGFNLWSQDLRSEIEGRTRHPGRGLPSDGGDFQGSLGERQRAAAGLPIH